MSARVPTRRPRAAWSSPPDPDAEQARKDVATARAVVEAVTRRVACGQDGAAAVATAQWRLHTALKRLDALDGHPAPTAPQEDPA